MSEFVLAKVEVEETAATIGGDRDHVAGAVEAIKAARADIERQIRRDRFFLTTIEPYAPEADAPIVIRRMCEAASHAGVGPMATVAGAIAQVAMESMVSQGCRHGWVDNGGDIALLLDEPATVEVFMEPGSPNALALELEPTGRILGVCSSSGRIGHSVSFGNADIALAIAEDAFLADALATGIANGVVDVASLSHCFDEYKEVKGFVGGLAVIDGSVAMHGRMPKLVEVEHNPERVSVHSKMASPKYVGAARIRTEAGS